jgi:hypothetical protein
VDSSLDKGIHRMEGFKGQGRKFNADGSLEEFLDAMLISSEKRMKLPVFPVEVNWKVISRILAVDEVLLAIEVSGEIKGFIQTFIAKFLQCGSGLNHLFRKNQQVEVIKRPQRWIGIDGPSQTRSSQNQSPYPLDFESFDYFLELSFDAKAANKASQECRSQSIMDLLREEKFARQAVDTPVCQGENPV